MNKMTIGRPRKKSTETIPPTEDAQSSRRRTADAVMIFGAAAVCGMLALPLRSLPMSPSEERVLPSEETAVMVMSHAVQTARPEKEEVIAPSNAEEEEWNFYDYIGELFAGLISGQ